jgi:hypothetical protein
MVTRKKVDIDGIVPFHVYKVGCTSQLRIRSQAVKIGNMGNIVEFVVYKVSPMFPSSTAAYKLESKVKDILSEQTVGDSTEYFIRNNKSTKTINQLLSNKECNMQNDQISMEWIKGEGANKIQCNITAPCNEIFTSNLLRFMQGEEIAKEVMQKKVLSPVINRRTVRRYRKWANMSRDMNVNDSVTLLKREAPMLRKAIRAHGGNSKQCTQMNGDVKVTLIEKG